MLTISLAPQTFWNNKVEGYIFLLRENFEKTPQLKKIEEFYPHVMRVLKRHKFTGKCGQSFSLTGMRDDELVQFLFFGIGRLDRVWHEELEGLRRVIGFAVHMIKKREINDAVLTIPKPKSFGVSKEEFIKHIAIAAGMADYEFISFKTDKKEFCKSTLLLDGGITITDDFKKSIRSAKIITESVNHARHLVDMPGNIVHPLYIAEVIKKMAQTRKLKCTIIGPEKAKKMGMGGFYAVQSGSEHDGQFIVLEYKSKVKRASTIALVGKGVTYDTGGISLKSSSGMRGMKYDMAGAAAVIGAIESIAQLRPQVNVVVVTPLVENMPSGKASRQDDIIMFYNGKTAEIGSTDAEGRLILADALAYVEKEFKPDVILDAATLTGACVIALGHFFSGLMTNDDVLAEKLKKSGRLTGDKVWPLPMHEDYKKAIQSKVADIWNISSPQYGGQTMCAGWFLKHFVEKTPYAHIDIAGTASDVPGISYLGKGATGAAIRLFVDFVMNYKSISQK